MLSDVELLARLVSFDTISGNSNLALAEFLAEYAAGARAEIVKSPDGTRGNLILRFGPDADDRSGLTLSGHMDVVPAGEAGWESDPFALKQGEKQLFARGSSDMKGFLALALHVALDAADRNDLKKPLVLVYTYDEEIGTLGARDLVENWPAADTLPRSTIIGEPTELRVIRMHKGHLRMQITLHGVSAHSGYPHLGKNAIEAAARVLVSLRGLRGRFERDGGPNSAFFPEVPFVPLNVGTIHGGSAGNVVPDHCVIELGCRPLPGMDPDDVEAAVREAVRNALPGEPHEVKNLGASPPLLLDEHARIHQELCGLTGQTCSHSVSFATDAGWLQKAGLQCVIFGPGSIEVAHKPNEFIPRADLEQARGFLRQAVERMCR